MTKEQAKLFIEKNNLKYYNWYNSHALQEREMLIYEEQGKWVVSATDERAAVVDGSIYFFDNESDALESFIHRLQALNRIMENKYK